VDATKIAFVQSVVSVKDGKPTDSRRSLTEKEKKIVAGRTISPGKAGEGTHIDENPKIRTPLYGMSGASGNDLANPAPEQFNDTLQGKRVPETEVGWHFRDSSKAPQNHDAMMHDQPYLSSEDMDLNAEDVMDSEWHQHMESAAIAIEGNQAGTFYGTVEWGWTKRVGDPSPHVLPFKRKSDNVPSPVFYRGGEIVECFQG